MLFQNLMPLEVKEKDVTRWQHRRVPQESQIIRIPVLSSLLRQNYWRKEFPLRQSMLEACPGPPRLHPSSSAWSPQCYSQPGVNSIAPCLLLPRWQPNSSAGIMQIELSPPHPHSLAPCNIWLSYCFSKTLQKTSHIVPPPLTVSSHKKQYFCL